MENALTFTYHRHSGDGVIDQNLAISNADRNSVVPLLALTALDRHRHPLPGVQVRIVKVTGDATRAVARYADGSAVSVTAYNSQ
ncbi:hypothetical protein OK006_5147 [Actinobacteria bacterium OK006]|nr:hypothetical protein OK006_5147 [Actinobacteria bacterium OK006]